ncbi:HD domain-containing protein [Stackebrandtia soli]|uniref:HD domain-containing protein n=1 Tax=Stackebrandtia soli TaxID=1892856 RepID=UPI0039EA056F
MPASPPEPSLTEVERLAARLHRRQVDKAGRPYIGHPRAVAARVAADGGSVHQQMAALLHDVVEDTEASLSTLGADGVPAPVLVLVDAMTKRRDESHEDYLTRLARVPGAALIKRADIAHNSDPNRLAALPGPLRARLRAKYEGAVRLLDRLEQRAER